MSEENYLTLRELLNESLLMDLVLFFLLFLLVVSQEWSNILIVLFPIITFSFSVFFRFIGSNKWRMQYKASQIIYNPLGSEMKHASRLSFCSIIQLVLIFWLGAESLYRPQLISTYYLIINIIFTFTYSFGFFWIFIDLWKNSKISLVFDNKMMKDSNLDLKSIEKESKKVLSFLKLKSYKKISICSLIIFLLLNIINLLFILLIFLGTPIGLSYYLPGTGLEASQPVILPHIILGIIVISPLSAILFLKISHKDIINSFNKNSLIEILDTLPEDIQDSIIRSFRQLSKKIENKINIE